jgi:O-antigen/teichoic acid export membrane protein
MTSTKPPAQPPVRLAVRAARGAAVTFGGQAARIVIQLASVIILARLLDSRDYGLFAMVLTVVGVGEIFRDFGLSSAAIQATVLTRQQRDNLFWINSAIGMALAVVVYFGAGLIAAVYRQPELVPIAQVLCITFIFNGAATQFRADLNRSLKFSTLAATDVIAPFIGLTIAIVTAVLGWGYWALVAQQMVQSVVLLALLAVAARWLPGLPHRKTPMGGLLKFGWNLVATQLVGYLSNNLDSFIIGVRFGAAPLGLYNRGYQILMTPLGQLRAPTTTVALPVLTRLKSDAARFDEFITRGQLALGYSLVAGLGIVVAAAEPITSIFLGQQWMGAAPILRLLAIAGIFQTLAYVGYWTYLARALTGELFRYTLVSAGIKIVCVAVGSQWGIVGVAAGYVVCMAVEWPLSLWWLSRRTSFPGRRLAIGALRIITLTGIAAIAGAVAVWAAAALGSFAQLGAAVLAAAVIYLAAILLVRSVRVDVNKVLHVVRMIPRARRSI